jgi:hypothetical protein
VENVQDADVSQRYFAHGKNKLVELKCNAVMGFPDQFRIGVREQRVCLPQLSTNISGAGSYWITEYDGYAVPLRRLR